MSYLLSSTFVPVLKRVLAGNLDAVAASTTISLPPGTEQSKTPATP
jgi:hypothetical protein